MSELLDFALNYWRQALAGILSVGLGTLFRWLRKKLHESDLRQAAMEKGIQALLRDRIVQAYYYHMDRGWITLYGLEAIDKMYTEYHNLGGNGAISKLWEDIHNLEVR